MKKKDINLIMAAVAVLVMLKTMVNRAFNEEEVDFEEEDDSDYEASDDAPSQVSDEEYEYFNEILEEVDLEYLTEESLEELDLEQLLQSFSDSLEFKLAIMKNSSVLKEMILKKKTSQKAEVEGEAVSDQENY